MARIIWSILVLLWGGCLESEEESPRGNAYEFVNLVSEIDISCIHYHAGSDVQRLSNKHPTRQVIVKRMTENNPTPEGPRVTIQDILLQPDATYRPIVGCTAFPDGRRVRRTVEEAWFVGL